MKDKREVEHESMRVILMEQMKTKNDTKQVQKQKETELEVLNLEKINKLIEDQN